MKKIFECDLPYNANFILIAVFIFLNCLSISAQGDNRTVDELVRDINARLIKYGNTEKQKIRVVDNERLVVEQFPADPSKQGGSLSGVDIEDLESYPSIEKNVGDAPYWVVGLKCNNELPCFISMGITPNGMAGQRGAAINPVRKYYFLLDYRSPSAPVSDADRLKDAQMLHNDVKRLLIVLFSLKDPYTGRARTKSGGTETKLPLVRPLPPNP